MWNFIKELRRKDHQRYLGGLDFFKYIGPGLLVTVGFIDPGNWASNFAAGADFGYSLLWVITLSTIMLIVLQHNVAHLGIVTGLCLSEAATKYTPKWVSRPILGTAVLDLSPLLWLRFWEEPLPWKCYSIFLLSGVPFSRHSLSQSCCLPIPTSGLSALLLHLCR